MLRTCTKHFSFLRQKEEERFHQIIPYYDIVVQNIWNRVQQILPTFSGYLNLEVFFYIRIFKSDCLIILSYKKNYSDASRGGQYCTIIKIYNNDKNFVEVLY